MTPAFVSPGPLDQLTGGYLFGRRIVDGLRHMGRAVDVFELEGTFPDGDEAALTSAARTLAALPDGAVVVIDGLALPAFTECLARETQRLRVIGLIHHPLSLESGLSASDAQRYAKIEARLWPLLRGILCPSTATMHAVIAAGIAPARVALAPPGTDKPASIPARTRRGPLHLLAVGTITPRKGHRVLVEALARLRDLDWRLACIGSLERDPAEASAVRAAIATSGLQDRVALLGERPHADLAAAYRDADVFVLPSYHEGYGMAYAEALAHGLPIVATTAGSIPEVVPASAALLVPPGDALALSGAVRSVLADAGLRERLAAGAARAAAALPDWPAAVRRWAEECDRLAA
ncbi:MAG TPA: glycosyltransferase family 4 protein [Burkholderiales bacterium]|nr:glycosyltransferase family 4 protein [Burkholderiales bacterium]